MYFFALGFLTVTYPGTRTRVTGKTFLHDYIRSVWDKCWEIDWDIQRFMVKLLGRPENPWILATGSLNPSQTEAAWRLPKIRLRAPMQFCALYR
jgi:hypothetical protein